MFFGFMFVCSMCSIGETPRLTSIRVRPTNASADLLQPTFQWVATRPTLLNDIAGMAHFKNKAVASSTEVTQGGVAFAGRGSLGLFSRGFSTVHQIVAF